MAKVRQTPPAQDSADSPTGWPPSMVVSSSRVLPVVPRGCTRSCPGDHQVRARERLRQRNPFEDRDRRGLRTVAGRHRATSDRQRTPGSRRGARWTEFPPRHRRASPGRGRRGRSYAAGLQGRGSQGRPGGEEQGPTPRCAGALPVRRGEIWKELLESGAEGTSYLLKDRVADVGEFVSALEEVGSGGTVLDPEVVGQLLARRRRDDDLSSLTPREREVLALVAEGRTNHAIASTLFVTEGAVEKHVKSIFGKLGLAQSEADHRRVLAVLAYLRS